VPSLLYEPINTYKPVAPSIGIVDGPHEYVSLLGIRMPWPFTTRMTIVRLANGDLFVHSPTAFDAGLAAQLRSIGRLRHLISPNRGHYARIGEWARAFPDALTWASPGVRERARSQRIDVHFERDLGTDAPTEWCDEIDQTIIPGAVLDEVVFFHKSSRTLIVADTIMNFETDRLRQPYWLIASLAGVTYPLGGISPDLRMGFLPQKRAVRPAIEKILSWQPGCIILSHGRSFDEGACAVIRRVYGWAL
jgi:hypothetical protein